MMTRRKRVAIVILILLILLLLIGWLLYVLLSGRASAPSSTPVVQEASKEEVIPSRPTVSEVELEQERQTRATSADVAALSKTFIERYGSYSNEAAFANLRDVLPLMSNAFAASTQAFIDEGEVPEEYYGVSTRIVSVEVNSKDEAAGRATVKAMTQREESVGSPQNETVKYQEIILTFVMEDGAWKIDSASWQ